MVEEGQLDCQQVTDGLPRLVSGALPAEEDRQARGHLASCASCARGFEEVRLISQLLAAHLPAGTLVDLAWDRPPTGIDADLARRHLESCAACAEELALTRESRRLEAQARRHTSTRGPLVWRWGALAAGLPLAFVGGMLWRTTRDSADITARESEKQALETRISDLQTEVRREQEDGQALKQQIDRLAGPQPNVPVVEVFPDSLTLRSTQASPNQVVVAADAAWVVLLLGSQKASSGPAVVEARDQAGRVVWRGSGLRPSPLGGYTLAIPSSLLPGGRYALVLSTQRGQTMESYALQVRRAE